MFDVSPVVQNAQPIVLAAAQAFWKHLSPWVIGIYVHGSVYKGDYIPGCSDVDMKIYLENEAFVANGTLPLALSMELYRDLAQIELKPFLYLQAYPLARNPLPYQPPEWTGPVPGTYHMVYGELPVAEATVEEIMERAPGTIERALRIPTDIPIDLLQLGKLPRRIRLLCTDMWPTLYSILTLQCVDDPLAVWQLRKEEAINQLPETDPMGQSMHRFYHCLRTYYATEHQTDTALQVVEASVAFLHDVDQWYMLYQQKCERKGHF